MVLQLTPGHIQWAQYVTGAWHQTKNLFIWPWWEINIYQNGKSGQSSSGDTIKNKKPYGSEKKYDQKQKPYGSRHPILVSVLQDSPARALLKVFAC